MLTDALKKLAADGPLEREKPKFFNVGKANAYIYELEKICGLEPRAPTFNIARANKRIEHLEAVLKQAGIALPSADTNKSALPSAKAAVAPVAPSIAIAPAAVAPASALPVPPVAAAKIPADDGILQATRAEFLKMDFATRRQFAQDGGHLKKSDFEKLTLAARSQFCVAGGKILDDTPANRRHRCTAAASFTSHEN